MGWEDFPFWWRRRRFPFFRFFEDIEDLMRDFERWVEREFRTFSERVPRELVRDVKTKEGVRREIGPLVWGWSITIGPDGKPEIREYGNVRPTKVGQMFELKREREPLVDIINEESRIRVIAELPGVSKDDIQLTTTEKTLTIKVDTEERKYYKEVELPEEVIPDQTKATYKNGILEITLQKREKGRKGVGIKIE